MDKGKTIFIQCCSLGGKGRTNGQDYYLRSRSRKGSAHEANIEPTL